MMLQQAVKNNPNAYRDTNLSAILAEIFVHEWLKCLAAMDENQMHNFS